MRFLDPEGYREGPDYLCIRRYKPELSRPLPPTPPPPTPPVKIIGADQTVVVWAVEEGDWPMLECCRGVGAERLAPLLNMGHVQ